MIYLTPNLPPVSYYQWEWKDELRQLMMTMRRRKTILISVAFVTVSAPALFLTVNELLYLPLRQQKKLLDAAILWAAENPCIFHRQNVRLYIAQSHLPFRSALSELLRTSLFRLFFAEPTLPILMMLMMMLLLMMMMMMMMMTMVMQPQTMLTPLSWNLCHHLLPPQSVT